MNISDVVGLAGAAHAGQLDAQGRDYFDAHLRPIAEGALLFGDQALEVAWLHDILEDTQVTVGELARRGVVPVVVRAIRSVTKRDGEPYKDLIARSAQDPIGRYVKLVDNAWNIACSPALATTDPERAQRMLSEKYLPAREVLLHATALSPDSTACVELHERLRIHVRRLAGEQFGITLRPSTKERGFVVDGSSVDTVYESEHGVVFLDISHGGNVDSYLTLPRHAYPAIRTALRVSSEVDVLTAVTDQIAGILAVGVPVWAAAHGIQTEQFTYINNDFWDRD